MRLTGYTVKAKIHMKIKFSSLETRLIAILLCATLLTAVAVLKLLEMQLFAALSGVLLLILALLIYLIKRIVRPLKQLTNVTEQLRESRQLLDSIVENIPIMVFVKRASDLRIELFNRAGQALTGYSSEQLLGKGNYDLWPKEQGDFFTAADNKVLASNEVTEIPEEPITRANGEVRYLHTWKVAIRNEAGEPTHLLGISIDITERKRWEDKLRDSEERLRLALEADDLGTWDLDLTTDTAVRSLRHDQLYGYAELQPKWGLEIALKQILAEDRPIVMEAWNRAMKDGELSVEMRVRWPDDSIHWISVHGRVQYNSAAQPVRMSGVVSDITARKQTELEVFKLNSELEERVTARTNELETAVTTLQRSEQRYRLLVDGVKDTANLMLDPAGHIIFWNEGCERLKGYTSEEIIGQHLSIFYPPEDVEAGKPQAELLKALAEGRVEDEGWRVRKDGTKFWANVVITPLYNDNGELQGYSKVTRDITARKGLVEQQAKTVKELADFKAALDEHAIVATTDVRGTITYVNDKFCAISQYSREELIGQNHRIVNSSRHPLEFFRELWRTIGQGHIWKGEINNRAKDGSFYWVQTTIVPLLDAHGKPAQYIAIRADITERKQAEQNLIVARNEAEQANKAKDSFLATMSHEIRTPLTGMLGMLEVLSLSKLDATQRDTLKIAWDSSRSLLRIVNDILDWSKIEAGQMQLEPQATSISQLLQEVANTYSRVASSKSLVLWQHPDVRLAHAHLVDSLRLSQILNNFVSNAIKFTRRGEVELRAELLEKKDDCERIRLSVKDTGIGIDKAAQQHLFQRYQQGSADTARMYGGTGLGLAICERLAKLMDGKIEFESEAGVGTTFSLILTLPVSSESAVAIRSLMHADVEQGIVKPLFIDTNTSPLVLAVDDHPTNRDLLSRQLSLLGLRAVVAENGHEALSLWRSGRFALIITDCHMPEMDGYAFTRAIRNLESEENLPRTPIIAWTANALAEEESLCMDAGMDDLLVKPTDMTQLKSVVAKWLPMADFDTHQMPTSPPVDDNGEQAGPIDYAELTKIVPENFEQQKLLNDFQTHLLADRSKLTEMLAAADRDNVERTAHRMKGSCRMVGAKNLASACSLIEQAARNGNMDGAKAAIPELDMAFEQLASHLAAKNNKDLS